MINYLGYDILMFRSIFLINQSIKFFLLINQSNTSKHLRETLTSVSKFTANAENL